MDDIFFYILVIIIIIIIIIVLYNYSKNIEKYNDIEFLNCHVFTKENNGTNVPFFYFPMECYNVRNNKYINEVVLHNNKGMTGESGKTQFSVSNLIYDRKCGDCVPIEQKQKNKIENIDNGQKELTIVPSIKIDYTIKTNKITFNRAYDPTIIDSNNISTLKALTNSYKKCESNQYNDKIQNLFNQSSIGECITCPPCDENQYSTCGGDSSLMGQCIDCTECPYGQYLKDCGGKNKGTCIEKQCKCDNGIPSRGTNCPENDAIHCQSCNDDYELDNTTCSACDTLKPDNSTYTPNTCEWNCNTDYTENPSENDYKCIIQCGEGYKRNASQNICEPCGINHYKSGPKNTNTECTLCPVGSTTNSNKTASSEESCQPKYGYKKDEEGIFSILDGYREEENSPGTIVSCEYNYQRQNETSECKQCSDVSNGKFIEDEYPDNCKNISCEPRYEPRDTQCVLKECNGYLDRTGECLSNPESIYGDGIRVHDTNNRQLVLKENYSWNNSKSTECELEKRRTGEITITDDNFDKKIDCEDCQQLNNNEIYIKGYGSNNKCNTECKNINYISETDDQGCEKLCDSGSYNRNDSCVQCPVNEYKEGKNTNTNCTSCPEGTTTNGVGSKNINQCLKNCGPGKYRNDDNLCSPCQIDTFKTGTNTNTSCSSCDPQNTTNGLTGQSSCVARQCPAGEFININNNYTCEPCPDNKYKLDGPNSDTRCLDCDHTRCEYNEYLINCGGDNEGNCTSCPDNQIRHHTENTCINSCGDNTYYDEEYCPDNSYYDQVNGLCVCEEGYKLNESGDSCVSSLKKLVGEPCSSGEDCYSDMCVLTLVNNSGDISYEKRCNGREYGEPCDTAEKHCSTSLHCTNKTCGPLKLGATCSNSFDTRCESGLICKGGYAGEYSCLPPGGLYS